MPYLFSSEGTKCIIPNLKGESVSTAGRVGSTDLHNTDIFLMERHETLGNFSTKTPRNLIIFFHQEKSRETAKLYDSFIALNQSESTGEARVM